MARRNCHGPTILYRLESLGSKVPDMAALHYAPHLQYRLIDTRYNGHCSCDSLGNLQNHQEHPHQRGIASCGVLIPAPTHPYDECDRQTATITALTPLLGYSKVCQRSLTRPNTFSTITAASDGSSVMLINPKPSHCCMDCHLLQL